MAIPSFGGMTIELIMLFFVSASYCLVQEIRLKLGFGAVGLATAPIAFLAETLDEEMM